jgi:hypothetical protein
VKDDNAVARKDSDVKTPDILKAAEEKMDRARLACSQEKWADSELHKRLIDDLKKATTEFLELRGDVEHTALEEIVFCECDHSNVDCTVEHWKTCQRRIQSYEARLLPH